MTGPKTPDPATITRVGDEQVILRTSTGAVLMVRKVKVVGTPYIQINMHDCGDALLLTEADHKRQLEQTLRVLYGMGAQDLLAKEDEEQAWIKKQVEDIPF